MNGTLTRQDEGSLLRRFARNGDPEAFSQIIGLYSGLVYGTCLRITGNQEHAADASQETFYQLLKNAGRITGSLGGWLHRVAARRAIDLVRREVARRQQESMFAQSSVQRETDQWSDVASLLDEAVNELHDELRELVIRHYLQGQSMVQIAAAMRVSQPTVSRRITQALEELRAKFQSKGVLLSAVALIGLMPNAASAMPAAVLQGLGKMVLAASVNASGKLAFWTALNVKAIGLGAITGVVLGAVLAPMLRTKSPADPMAQTQLSANQLASARNLNIPPRDSRADAKLIDLTGYYNAPLNREWHDSIQPGNDLADLPNGLQTFAGVLFDVRGLVQVISRDKVYPVAIEGIPIGQKCHWLQFLHSAIRAAETPDGTEIGRYLVHYTNGERRDISIRIGYDVVDWFEQPRVPRESLVIAWMGENAKSRYWKKKIRLYKSAWENPLPEVAIQRIDFVALQPGPSPFLVALTAE